MYTQIYMHPKERVDIQRHNSTIDKIKSIMICPKRYIYYPKRYFDNQKVYQKYKWDKIYMVVISNSTDLNHPLIIELID